MINKTLHRYRISKIKNTGEYVNDKKNGIWSEYNEDGSLKSESFFKDGYIGWVLDEQSIEIFIYPKMKIML